MRRRRRRGPLTASMDPGSPPDDDRSRREAAAWEGTDPDPRLTFANERTFLAWTRTGLALIAGGSPSPSS